MLDHRDLIVLNELFQHAVVSLEELARKTATTTRTIPSLIQHVTDFLAEKDCAKALRYQRGHGYCLIVEGPLVQIKQQVAAYLNWGGHVYFEGNIRAICISQRLLRSQEHIKIDDLADYLNVSTSTVHKELKVARKFLSAYGLKVQATPYYGLQVTGAANSMIVCCLALESLRWYEFLSWPEELFFEGRPVPSDKLAKLLNNGHIKLTQTGYDLLCRYLAIKGSLGIAPQLSEKVRLYVTSSSIYQASQIVSDTAEERLFITLLLLLHQEMSTVQLPAWPENTEKLLQLKGDWQAEGFNDATVLEDIFELTEKFYFKSCLQKWANMTTCCVATNRRKLFQEMPATVGFSLRTAVQLQVISADLLQDPIFSDYTIDLYNVICRIKNRYEETRVVVANEYGLLANETLRRHITFNDHSLKFSYIPPYQIPFYDFAQTDFLFVTKQVTVPQDIQQQVPVVTFDFLKTKQLETVLLNSLLSKKRTIGSVTPYFWQSEITMLKQGESWQTYLARRVGLVMPRGIDQRRWWYQVVASGRYLRESEGVLLTCFATGETDYRYQVIQLPTKVIVNGLPVRRFHLLTLNAQKGFVEVKNADSEIKRFFSDD